MLTMPTTLASAFAVAHSQFHDADTSETARNAIVTDILSELRQHDPNISIWDLLPLFDARLP